MTAFLSVILIAIWPFHHKQQEPPTDPNRYVVVQGQAFECDRNPEGWYVFLGPDGLIGASEESCSVAYQEWTHNYGPKNIIIDRA